MNRYIHLELRQRHKKNRLFVSYGAIRQQN